MLNYQCPGEAERDPDKPPLQCKLGHLIPSNPHCGVLGHGTNADWLGNFEISASSHIVKNGNLDIESAQLDVDPNDERLSKMSVISENVVQSQEDSDAPCAKPNHIEGTLIYKGNSKVLYHPVPYINLAPSSGIVVIFRVLFVLTGASGVAQQSLITPWDRSEI